MISARQKSTTLLDQYRSMDENHQNNNLYDAPEENFSGPVSKRSCTDCGFIPFFLGILLFTTYYAYISSKQYDLNRIFYGRDFRNDLCGIYQLEERPFQYFLNPSQWGDISICVKQCPQPAESDIAKICLYDNDGKQELEDYCYVTYYTDPYRQYCMPLELGKVRSQIETIKNSDINLAKISAGDFQIGLGTIIGAMVVQVIFAFAFVVLLLQKKLAHVLMWIFIFGFCIALGLISVFIGQEKMNVIAKDCQSDIIHKDTGEILIPAPDPYECVPYHLILLDVITYTLLILIPVYGIYMIASFSRLLRMIQIMNSTLSILKTQPAIFLIPLMVSAVQIFLSLIVLLILIGGVSSGVASTVPAPPGFPNQFYRTILFETWQARGFYVLIVIYFWLLQTSYYYCRLATSIATSIWYFSRDKTYVIAPVRRAVWYSFRYHLGSMIFASMILVPTWVLTSFMHHYRVFLDGFKSKSSTLNFLILITSPMLTFHEYGGKFISNKNLMHMGIFGDNFLISGQKVFYINNRNKSRTEMTGDLVGYVRIIGMFCSSAAGMYLVYFQLYSNQIKKDESKVSIQIEFPIVPSLFVFITGIYLCQNFSSMIDIIVETIFFALVADEEMFMGSQRFVEIDFVEFINKFSKEKEKREYIVLNRGKRNLFSERQGAEDFIQPIDNDDLVEQDAEGVEFINDDNVVNVDKEQKKDDDDDNNSDDSKTQKK